MSQKDASASADGLRHAEVDRLLQLIDAAGYDETDLEIGDLKIRIRKGSAPLAHERPEVREPGPAPAEARSAPASVGPPSPPPADEIPPGLIAVRAPLLGTFYGSPSPGAPRFIQPGQRVAADDTVCLLEVMKIFSSVPAGVSGTIVRLLVEDGQMVEHDQPIILIDPALAGA